jgi:hypothetical protein
MFELVVASPSSVQAVEAKKGPDASLTYYAATPRPSDELRRAGVVTISVDGGQGSRSITLPGRGDVMGKRSLDGGPTHRN